MTETRQPNPVVTFYGAVPGIRAPIRADASGLGTLPSRGFQYCEALRTASSFGWYVFPPILFSTEMPVLQVQPLHRSTYAEEVTNRFGMVPALADFPARAWERYETNIVRPREVGAYAVEVRRRRRSGCPVHA